MASISTDMNFDIQNLVEERRLDGNIFSGDKDANVFSVRVYDNGVPVDLTGWSVSGSIIKPNGQTISGVTGSVSSEELNRVFLPLPESAYALPGDITVIIKVTKGTTTTTIAAIVVNVFQSSTSTVINT